MRLPGTLPPCRREVVEVWPERRRTPPIVDPRGALQQPTTLRAGRKQLSLDEKAGDDRKSESRRNRADAEDVLEEVLELCIQDFDHAEEEAQAGHVSCLFVNDRPTHRPRTSALLSWWTVRLMRADDLYPCSSHFHVCSRQLLLP